MHLTFRPQFQLMAGRLLVLTRMVALGCLAICLLATAMTASAQNLTGVQSRKTHTLGNSVFDLPIDLNPSITGAITFEPRVIGSGHMIVFQFDTAIAQPGTPTAVDANGMPIGTANAALNPGNANEVIVT